MGKETGIIVAVVALSLYFGRNVLNNKLYKDLMSVIGQDEEKFLKLINSLIVKLSFQPFNRDYMTLNHYIMMENDEMVEKQFQDLDAHKLNQKQTLNVYQKVFMYYVKKNNAAKAKDVYERICRYVDEKGLPETIKTSCEKDLLVYIDKNPKVLKTLDQMLENANNDAKALLYLEKTYVLKYNRRMDEAMKTMEKVIEYTANENQKKVMQDLLDTKLEAL